MTRTFLCFVTLFVSAFWCTSAICQTVQLPTIEVFNINTAVMVPDGGMTYLGGVGRVRYGSNTVGVPGLSNIPGMNRLFKNRGIGHDISSSNAAVTAKIIILEELEQEVLAEAKRRQASRAHQAELEKEADRISNQIGRSRK